MEQMLKKTVSGIINKISNISGNVSYISRGDVSYIRGKTSNIYVDTYISRGDVSYISRGDVSYISRGDVSYISRGDVSYIK